MLVYIDAACAHCECAMEIKCNARWSCEAKDRQFCFVCGWESGIGTCPVVSDKLPIEYGDCRNFREKVF